MRHAFLALVRGVALPLAACNSATEGSALKGAGDPPPPAIDFDQLDVGPHPTVARPSPPTFIDEPSGDGALDGIPVTVAATAT